ncbi:MAG: hypothetical protein P4M11_04565 [Candidatus Pacebacteria bacterium]|nr:hypothetical protein [Candidatus Paceibacterota bacterium]
MGSAKSSERGLKEHEILEYSKISSFSHEEIDNLYQYYQHFSAACNDDGVIDYREFCQAMSLADTLVAQRIFKLFDTNADEVINFREFIIGLACFLYETTEQQINLSFRLFDITGRGYCTPADLQQVLISYFSIMPSLMLLRDKSEDPEAAVRKLVESMVKATFDGLGLREPGKIQYKEYRRLYFRNGFATKWLTMDMEKLKQGVLVLTRRVPVIRMKSAGICSSSS